jgi:hypothetical protein
LASKRRWTVVRHPPKAALQTQVSIALHCIALDCIALH